MKRLLLSALAIASLGTASAAQLDFAKFGQSLAGWDATGQSCNYLFNDGTYRTLRPNVTATRNGGLFVSVVVEFDPRGGVDATGWLEFTFNSNNQLIAAQAKVRMIGKFVDTGAVRATEEAVGVGENAGTKLQNSDQVMIDLFNRLDQKMVDVRQAIEEKRDNSVVSRMKYGKFKRLNMSAALRHNANAVLRSVR